MPLPQSAVCFLGSFNWECGAEVCTCMAAVLLMRILRRALTSNACFPLLFVISFRLSLITCNRQRLRSSVDSSPFLTGSVHCIRICTPHRQSFQPCRVSSRLSSSLWHFALDRMFYSTSPRLTTVSRNGISVG